MKIIIAILMHAATNYVHAHQSPVSWTFTAVRTGSQTYELRLAAKISANWHVYSQFTPAGGPVASQIVLDPSPMVVTEGPVKEEGKMISKHDDVFGIDVQYFGEQVVFVQRIKLVKKVKTTVAGSITYMVCSDRECLPPTRVPFRIRLD